jgi:hypothetical protein
MVQPQNLNANRWKQFKISVAKRELIIKKNKIKKKIIPCRNYWLYNVVENDEI